MITKPAFAPSVSGVAELTRLRGRVIATTNDLFAHAPYPLDTTGRYAGDAGLFGPDSITWPVIGDASVFVGGIRALLVQAAHPEVVAGVFDHSRFREDPLGRLGRTSADCAPHERRGQWRCQLASPSSASASGGPQLPAW